MTPKRRTTTKNSASRERPEDEWHSFDAETYRRVALQLVHASVKTVNSNATPGGVRLGPQAALDLPYISARTLMADGVDLATDYPSNSGRTATVVKQINAVLRHSALASLAPPEERQSIFDADAHARSLSFDAGLDLVDLRLRQLLLPQHPDRDGAYAAITPITPSGVCYHLLDYERGAVSKHNNDAFEERQRTDGAPRRLRPIPRAVFGIGGSNPQNVGSLVRSMQRPLVVRAPTRNDDLRAALAIYYKGCGLRFARRHVEAFRTFLDARLASGTQATSMGYREAEQELVSTLVHDVKAAAAEAEVLLRQYEDRLPRLAPLGEPFAGQHAIISTGRRVTWAEQGLLDERLRDPAFDPKGERRNWERVAAIDILRALSGLTRRVDGVRVALFNFDAAAQAKLESLVEGLL